MSTPPRRSKSSSTTRSVLFVTSGDLRRATGGNVYARHMLAALRRAGLRVTTLSIEDGRAVDRLRATRADLVLVDTVAAHAASELERLRARRSDRHARAHGARGRAARATFRSGDRRQSYARA